MSEKQHLGASQKKWKCDYIRKDCRYINPASVFLWMDYLERTHPQLTNRLTTCRQIVLSAEKVLNVRREEIFFGISSLHLCCKLPRPLKILTLQSTLAHANTDIAPFVCLFSFVLIFPLPPSWCFCQHILLSGERDGGKKKGFTPALFVSAPYMSWGLSYQECFLLHLHITRRCSLSSLLLTRTHNRSCFLSPPAQIRPEPNHSGGTYWAKTELTAKLSACWINLTLKVTLQINIRHQKY